MQPVDYAWIVVGVYVVGVLTSIIEKLSAYRFSVRYEDISRSRETKREVKEIRLKVREELPWSLLWPVEVWNLFKRGW
jgi:hypothetical protein